MENEYDIIVIGAGIHGVGIAQAGAAAGYHTLVLEQSDIAAATSCSSSKLIHGGLRYLESARFGLVRESLREQKILLRNAPHLVHRLPFHIPVFHNSRRRRWQIAVGLSLYRLLGGSAYKKIPQTQWSGLDGLNNDGLQAVYRYHDAQTDDGLLTMAVMQSAIGLGARLICPAQFIAAEKNGNNYQVHYQHDQQTMETSCSVLINASGPWVNEVLECIKPTIEKRSIELVQGSHIIVPGHNQHGAYYVEAPQDGRAVFVLPWKDRTMVGTTETVYSGDPSQVKPLDNEISYLQTVLQHYFPQHDTTVTGSFAGLRVLPSGEGAAFHRARDTMLQLDDVTAPRCLSVYGGKLTAYRATAEKIIRIISTSLPPRTARADTRTLVLPKV